MEKEREEDLIEKEREEDLFAEKKEKKTYSDIWMKDNGRLLLINGKHNTTIIFIDHNLRIILLASSLFIAICNALLDHKHILIYYQLHTQIDIKVVKIWFILQPNKSTMTIFKVLRTVEFNQFSELFFAYNVNCKRTPTSL